MFWRSVKVDTFAVLSHTQTTESLPWPDQPFTSRLSQHLVFDATQKHTTLDDL